MPEQHPLQADAARTAAPWQALLDALPVAVALLGGSGTILSVNKAWRTSADAGLTPPAPRRGRLPRRQGFPADVTAGLATDLLMGFNVAVKRHG